VSLLLIFLVFCVVLLCVFTFCVPCCDVRSDFRIKRCPVRLYLQLFVGGIMPYLRYLCLFAYYGVQHILCCVFALYILCCQFLWIDHILIAASVFSNVYLQLFCAAVYRFQLENTSYLHIFWLAVLLFLLRILTKIYFPVSNVKFDDFVQQIYLLVEERIYLCYNRNISVEIPSWKIRSV
jgi:hypothetical protein